MKGLSITQELIQELLSLPPTEGGAPTSQASYISKFLLLIENLHNGYSGEKLFNISSPTKDICLIGMT